MAGSTAEEGLKCPVPHDKPHPMLPPGTTMSKEMKEGTAEKGSCPVSHGAGSGILFISLWYSLQSLVFSFLLMFSCI